MMLMLIVVHLEHQGVLGLTDEWLHWLPEAGYRYNGASALISYYLQVPLNLCIYSSISTSTSINNMQHVVGRAQTNKLLWQLTRRVDVSTRLIPHRTHRPLGAKQCYVPVLLPAVHAGKLRIHPTVRPL